MTTPDQEKAIREAAEKYSKEITHLSIERSLDSFIDFTAGAKFGISLCEKESAELRRKLEIAEECVKHYACLRCQGDSEFPCYGYRSCEILKQIQEEPKSSNPLKEKRKK